VLRGRVISTTYEYDENGRVVRSFASPAWTSEDHDLLIGLAEYEATLCPGCGHPKDWAWHPGDESAGWFDKHEFTCQACATAHGPERATYSTAIDTWPAGKPHPPWPDEHPATPAPPPPIPE
jgi:hypothetical protein